MIDGYRRFVVLSSPRSGTHMLRTALGQHPAIVAQSEVFNPDWTKGAPFDGNTPAKEILERHVFLPRPPGVGAVGFVLHRRGAKFGGWPDLWDLLEADRTLHVISLRRLDMLRRYLSWRVMREPKTSPPSPKVVPPDELLAELEQHEADVVAFDRRFAQHPLLSVTYEDLCSAYQPTIRRIQEFLGVEALGLKPTTTRNPSVPLYDAIANFAELAAAFAGTRWAPLFERGPILASQPVTMDLEL
jgi:hypothetical protein